MWLLSAATNGRVHGAYTLQLTGDNGQRRITKRAITTVNNGAQTTATKRKGMEWRQKRRTEKVESKESGAI